MQEFCRMEMLLGKDNLQKLQQSHVAVFGMGGVGCYVIEALARAGIGALTIVDDDVFAPSNINRQLYALQSTLGHPKVEIAKSRIADINPSCQVTALKLRFDGQTVAQFDFTQFSYVVDAIDTVTSKLLLAKLCNDVNTPIISCMGTGNKLDATAFQVADIFQTSVCPLAKIMRKELKALGVPKLKVVYSTEIPCKPTQLETSNKRQTPASISFVPPVAGLILAGEVIKDIAKIDK